jgi:predicted acetyltransferase
MGIEYGLAREDDVPALVDILSWSFAMAPSDPESWLRKAGLPNVRVARLGGRVAACAILIPMGQFFGGRSVPMVGISGVATAPESRGTGAALAMMRALVCELHEAGSPLTTLYPATRALYRGADYEVAGSRAAVKVPARRLRLGDRGLALRPAGDADRAEIERVYRAHAARSDGHLDRNEYEWSRMRNPRQEQGTRGFVVEGAREIEGYAYVAERVLPSRRYDVRFVDVAALTPAAARRLLSFAGDHATLAESVRWQTGPTDPLLMLVPEIEYTVEETEHWMLRVVDVARALEARGYPEGVTAELHLEVRDEVVAANTGRFVLDVAGGVGRVSSGGEGRIRTSIRGLAPLYSGYLTPHALAVAGLVEGDAAELAKASLVLNGPPPWMPDMF